MRKITKAISAIAVASALTATMAVAASAEKAGITFQMSGNYMFRNTLFQSNILVGDQDYYGETGEEPFVEDDTGAPYYKMDGTITDVDITGDGSYSVSIKGHSLANKSGNSSVGYNMFKLATTIDPAQYPDLKITIDKVTIAGQELTPTTTEFTGETLTTEEIKADSFVDQDVEPMAGAVTFSLINVYGDSLVDASLVDANGDLTVDFTVSGMTAATDTPTDEGDATEPTEGDNSGKPSTNTGAEGIAVAAGVAVLATGAAIVAKKRK